MRVETDTQLFQIVKRYDVTVRLLDSNSFVITPPPHLTDSPFDYLKEPYDSLLIATVQQRGRK